jgi:hypothetical protein
LNRRWQTVAEAGSDKNKKEDDFPLRMQKELLPLEGQAVFDHIRSELTKPFSYDKRLQQINQRALDAAKECIRTWGGVKARERIKHLALLPLRCQSTDSDTQFSFDRTEKWILVEAGSPAKLLLESLFLEFSFFHEYLSHVFPAWSKDVEPVSEGFLLALEFEWLQSRYTLFDYDIGSELWDGRLKRDRRSFRIGQWLIRRCDSLLCVRKFFLEWVAGWGESGEKQDEDLLSELLGIYKKTGSRFGGAGRAKALKTMEILDSALCGPCPTGTWDTSQMTKLLSSALLLYESGQ